jgi:hypothetical protein
MDNIHHDGVPLQEQALLPHHLEQLTHDSGILPEVITERGYRSIVPPDGYTLLKQYGFSPAQAKNVPGLLLPLWTTDRRNGLMVYRPDTPRQDKDGHTIKYEIPKSAGVRLDCPPRCQPMLANPAIPLWITEGQKKADALASRGACAVDMLGVWNFRGKNAFGAITALPDWGEIGLGGRDVRVVFDSDVMTKPQVSQALKRLKAYLEYKGAHVAAVYLPQEAGRKVGVDDYLRTHSLQDLEGLIEAPRPEPQPAAPIITLLPSAPERLARPLALIDGTAYAATWLHTRLKITERAGKDGTVIKLAEPEQRDELRLFIIREDGTLFGELTDRNVQPLCGPLRSLRRSSRWIWPRRTSIMRGCAPTHILAIGTIRPRAIPVISWSSGPVRPGSSRRPARRRSGPVWHSSRRT